VHDKDFEINTALAVSNEHLSFVKQLCSSSGVSEDNFVLTWAKLRDCKAVQATFVVINLLMVHTEALIFKCRMSEAAVQHALNWEANCGLDKPGHRQIAEFYEENEVMELMQQKAKLIK